MDPKKCVRHIFAVSTMADAWDSVIRNYYYFPILNHLFYTSINIGNTYCVDSPGRHFIGVGDASVDTGLIILASFN